MKKSKTVKVIKFTNMVTIVILFLTSLISGCASIVNSISGHPPKSKEIMSSLFSDSPGITEESKLKNELKLSTGAENLYYFFAQVYPLTNGLIILEAKEKSRKAMEDEAASQKRVNKELDLYSKNTSCFVFFVATSGIEESRFKNFVAKLEDASGKAIDLTFLNTNDVDSVPTPVHDTVYPVWQNYSIACSSKIDFTRGFKIHINNLLVKDSPKQTLEWKIKK